MEAIPMTIIQLEYVLALAKYGSFSKAADALYISQPALSLQIASLEKELEFHLFHRSARGVKLTDYGKRFCEHAEKVISAWYNLKSDMEECKQGSKKKIKVGLGTRVYSNKLFDKIISFFDRHPEIDVTFISDFTQNTLDDLYEGRLDVALERLPPDNISANIKNFYYCDLITERQCFILSKNDPKSHEKELDYCDLKDYYLISAPEGSRLDLNVTQDCIEHNLPMGRAFRSNNMNDCLKMVRMGKGYLIGPASFGDYFDVCAVPKKDQSYASLCFICLNLNKDIPIIQEFRTYMQEICKEIQESCSLSNP